MTPASADDWRELARRRLPRVLFDYIDGGAYAELTLRRNVEDLAALALRQRVMRDVSRLSLSTELFGETLAMPVVLGPVGLAGMYARRGEVQAARAAQAAGVPFTLSTVAVCPVEEVAQGVGAAPWFQLYMIRDRGYMRALLQRAQAAGCRTLVFTVDLPTPGTRYRDVRSGMFGRSTPGVRLRQALQGLARPGWLWDVHLNGRPHVFGNIAAAVPEAQGVADFWVWVKENFDPSVTWADLDWVRGLWSGPIVVKGVLDPEDARAARDAGADGLVVSNHGGRQLDGVRSGAAALPGVVEAVGEDLTVLMDGGVRSGLDVLKALALGARGVLLGRGWAFPLAAAGEAGVRQALGALREELATAMMLTGCTDVRQAGPELLDRSAGTMNGSAKTRIDRETGAL
jgi:L-lactate dehydrogenase (cytochrome)